MKNQTERTAYSRVVAAREWGGVGRAWVVRPVYAVQPCYFKGTDTTILNDVCNFLVKCLEQTKNGPTAAHAANMVHKKAAERSY